MVATDLAGIKYDNWDSASLTAKLFAVVLSFETMMALVPSGLRKATWSRPVTGDEMVETMRCAPGRMNLEKWPMA